MNKHDGVWIPLAECFAEKPGMVLPVGTILNGEVLGCSGQLARVLWPSGWVAPATGLLQTSHGSDPWNSYKPDSQLVLPTGERLTVAEACDRVKPQPARGVKAGDCVRNNRGEIWMLLQKHLESGRWLWGTVPYPNHYTNIETTSEPNQAGIRVAFGDCLVASWPDTLRWLLEDAERKNG